MGIERFLVAIPVTRATQLGKARGATDSIVTETYLKTPNSLGRRAVKRTFGTHTTYEYDGSSAGAATDNFFKGTTVSKEKYEELLEEANLALPEVLKRVITTKPPNKLEQQKLVFLPFWKDKAILEIQSSVYINTSQYKPIILEHITGLREYSDLVLTISGGKI